MSFYVSYNIANIILLVGVFNLIIALFKRLDAEDNRDLFVTTCGVFIVTAGWYGIGLCTQLDNAIIYHKIIMIGSLFFLGGYVTYVCRINEIKHGGYLMIPGFITLGGFFAHAGRNIPYDPFLGNLRLESVSGVSILVGDRGYMYWAHIFYIMAIGIWGGVYAARNLLDRRKRAERRVLVNSIFFLVAGLFQVATQIIYETHYYSMVSILPLTWATTSTVYSILSFRYHIFNYDTLARQSLINDIGAGFVVLSDNFEVLYCNDIAYTVLPEMASGDSEYFRTITRRKEFQTEINGSTYKVTADRILSEGKIQGYTILIVDISDIALLQKQAEANEKTRQNLLTNISHEIRTPLNAIIGASELINSEDISREDFKQYAENIRVSTINLDDILNNILTASSSYEKVQSSDMAPYSVFTLVDNIVGMCNDRVDRNNVKLSVSFAEDIPINAIGDDRRIRQVLLNILTGAIRYTDDGFVSLRVSGEYLKDGRFKYIYTVQDTGKSVFNSSEDFDRIVSEGDVLGIDYNTGYGISLTVAKKIAAALDGDVSMYSLRGKGNVYSVTIPSLLLDKKTLENFDFAKKLSITFLGESDYDLDEIKHSCFEMGIPYDEVEGLSKLRKITDDARFYRVLIYDYDKYARRVAASERADSYVKVGIISGRKLPKQIDDSILVRAPLSALTIQRILAEQEMRIENEKASDNLFAAPSAKILVVDDNTLNLSVARNMLERFNVSVDTAKSGYECLDLIGAGHSYDLIFMDYMMEGMDGVETTKKIRTTDGPMSKVPIVAYTANSVEGAMEKYLAAGMNGCVFKPANMYSFADALKKYLPKELLVFEKKKKRSEVLKTKNEFPDIEGINKDSAIKYSGGNLEMFEDMIATFALEIPDKEKTIRKYVNEGNFKNLTVMVHGIKGLARTMGMDELSARMADMEKASAAEDEAYIKKNLPDLLSQYRHYGIVLSPYAEKKLSRRKPVSEGAGLKGILQRMLECLDEFEMDETEKLFDEIHREDYDDKRAPLFDALKDSIERGDYYASKEQVEKLLATYGEED
ncbi:MAG: response regulator [Lachnospiraceae bacterium]|nr:response regulator [Lachnospiraceae bacterium]